MRAYLLLSLLTLMRCIPAHSQHTNTGDRRIDFPDVPGYHTLKVDLHLHTVFSDGSVWPDIRVQEALRDGLDAIAITDHLEYQPHRDDIPHPDRNRSYEIALRVAGNRSLLVLPGSEITRSMPPGHANAVFIRDANALLMDEPMDVFREAKRQGAFIFWNHPMWVDQRPDGVATLTEMHSDLIQNGLLDGIEVVNDLSYSEEALQIALDHNLAILGTSDIHGLVDWQYRVPEGGHRPVTLVFSRDRSIDGIKEALMAGRTAVWFENLLVGRAEHAVPLIQASISVREAQYDGESSVLEVHLENISDAAYLLRNRSEMTLDTHGSVVMLEPHSTAVVRVRTLTRPSAVSLDMEVLNVIVAPREHATIGINIEVQ